MDLKSCSHITSCRVVARAAAGPTVCCLRDELHGPQRVRMLLCTRVFAMLVPAW